MSQNISSFEDLSLFFACQFSTISGYLSLRYVHMFKRSKQGRRDFLRHSLIVTILDISTGANALVTDKKKPNLNASVVFSLPVTLSILHVALLYLLCKLQ